jgi:DNA-binding response OmpR family regulator
MTDKNNLVLVLDDDEDIHNLLKLELSKSNFTSKHALNEKEAIKLLAENDFTYGIFDIILSSTSSSNKIIKFLSQNEAAQNQGLPLIIMSAHITDEYSKKLRVKGTSIIDTLKKPFKSGDLTNILNGNEDNSILLLEDDSDTSKLIKNELEKKLYKVYCVRDCQSAIKLLKTTKFLCAIIDNKLGADQSSEVFFHYLRNEGLQLNLPLILTGTTVREDLEVDSFLLVFDTVEKPFKRGDFVKSIEKLLNWKESQATPEANHISNIDNLEDLLSFDDIEDENIMITGRFAENENNTLVAGQGQDEDSNSLVKGQGQEEGNNSLVKGQGEEEDSHSVVSGKIEEDDGHTIVSGQGQELDDTPDNANDVNINKKPNLAKNPQSNVKTNSVWAVQNLQAPPEPTDMEAAQNYNPNQRNDDGITSVMMASLIGDVQMIQDAILYGGDIGLRSKDGKSCLHYAAASKNPDAIKFLLEQGLKVNTRDEHNREAIYFAITSKNIDNVNTLLEAGCRTSTRFEGRSYLTIAVLAEHAPSVEVLIEQGLSATFKDYSGKTPLDYAKIKNNNEIYQLLLGKKE